MISLSGFFAPLGAPAPMMNMFFVTAGNELIPLAAFVVQSTAPVCALYA